MSVFDEKNDVRITKEILSEYGFVEAFGLNKYTNFKDAMTKYICPKPFSLVNARIYYDKNDFFVQISVPSAVKINFVAAFLSTS